MRAKLRRKFDLALGQLRGRWWSWARKGRLRPRHGAVPLNSKVAIYLIFQPAGCPRSLFSTLEHIVLAGYAPVVVSNGPLSPGDRDRILPLSWQVLERPNLGYDFGGYRDGIWLLDEQGVRPDRLLVMNDTVWLPVISPLGTLQQLEALDADYAALCNFVYRPRSGRSDALVRRTYASSFCFLLSAKAISSAAFRDYWRRMPLYSAKPMVVQHGEVGFSRAMSAAGFEPKVLWDHRDIRDRVAGMAAPELGHFLRGLPILNKRILADYAAALARLETGELGETELRSFLLDLLDELNPWDSLAFNGLALGWTDFLKKSNLQVAGNARRFLELAGAADLALDPAVRAEIETLARG